MNLHLFDICWILFSVLLVLEYQSRVLMCGQKANKSVQQSGTCRRRQNYNFPDLDKTLICIGHRVAEVHVVCFRSTDVQSIKEALMYTQRYISVTEVLSRVCLQYNARRSAVQLYVWLSK